MIGNAKVSRAFELMPSAAAIFLTVGKSCAGLIVSQTLPTQFSEGNSPPLSP